MIGLVLAYDHRVDGTGSSVEVTEDAVADTEQSLQTDGPLAEWLPDTDDRLAALALFFLTWRAAHPDVDGDDHAAFSEWIAGLDDIRVDPETRFLTDAIAELAELAELADGGDVGELGADVDLATLAEV